MGMIGGEKEAAPRLFRRDWDEKKPLGLTQTGNPSGNGHVDFSDPCADSAQRGQSALARLFTPADDDDPMLVRPVRSSPG